MPALKPDNDSAPTARDNRDNSPEALLVAQVASGDRHAFDQLARHVLHPALGLAIRIMGDSTMAEDVVQEALAKLWQKADSFDPVRGYFAGWWRRILVNSALDSRRRLRLVVPLDDIAEAADPTPGPLAQAEASDMARQVQQAMIALPTRQRAALALFHGEGLSMQEIADTLDATPKAVEGLLLRGRTALRTSLAHLKDEIA